MKNTKRRGIEIKVPGELRGVVRKAYVTADAKLTEKRRVPRKFWFGTREVRDIDYGVLSVVEVRKPGGIGYDNEYPYPSQEGRLPHFDPNVEMVPFVRDGRRVPGAVDAVSAAVERAEKAVKTDFESRRGRRGPER